MKKYLKKDVFDVIADVITSEPVKVAKQYYKTAKQQKSLAI